MYNILGVLRTTATQVHCFAATHTGNFHSEMKTPQLVTVVATPPTPLHAACSRGDAKEALTALTTSTLNAQDADGETPAMKATQAGSLRTLELLIKAGANFEISDAHGWTVLHWAVQSNRAEMVGTILDYAPVLLNVRDKRGLTPLHVAAWTGNAVLVRRLLSEGADVHATTQWGETPLHMTAYFGHLETSEALIEAGADLGREDRMKRTPRGLVGGLDDKNSAKLRMVKLFGAL